MSDINAFYNETYSPSIKLDKSLQQSVLIDLQRIEEDLNCNHDAFELSIGGLILKLISLRFVRSNSVDEMIPKWLNDVCYQMRQHGNFAKGIEYMQSISYCSKEHLCRSFRKYIKKTPTQFINELRINSAASQLVHTDAKIFSIALENGFNNLSHFYLQFKKFYGMSPAAYRKKHLRNIVP